MPKEKEKIPEVEIKDLPKDKRIEKVKKVIILDKSGKAKEVKRK